MGRFKILGDVSVADRTVEIEGSTMDDLFETAVRALGEVLCDPAALKAPVERTFTLSARDQETLFHHWICELIYLRDRYCEVYTGARARVTGERPCSVVARLSGGTAPACRPEPRPDIEETSPQGFRFQATGGALRARFVVPMKAIRRLP